MNKVTMQTIADNLGLSRSLVSRALSDRYGVNTKTKSLIECEAKRLGYTSLHPPRKSPSSGNIPTILAIMPRSTLLDSMFGAKIINSLDRTIKNHHLLMSLVLYDDNTDELPISLFNPNVKGIIVLSHNLSEKGMWVLEEIKKLTPPTVLIDPQAYADNFDIIMADNYMGMYKLTEYIISKGHRKLMFVGCPEYSISFLQRYRGCKDCVNLHKEVTCRFIHSFHPKYPFNKDEFAQLLDEFVKLSEKGQIPTAIICANDPCAFNVYAMLKERNLRIPEDVSVVGFDNVERASYESPPLTTVDLSTDDLAEKAIQLLDSKSSNSINHYQLVQLGTTLVLRDSVKEIK